MYYLGQILSVLGAICVLSAYWGLTSGRYNRHSVRYHRLNLLAGFFFIASCSIIFILGGLLLNIFWSAIAVRALLKESKGDKNV